MEKVTKKMDEVTKSKLIYSGELALFGILFAVIGILIILRVIGIMDWKRYMFTYVTLIGGFILYGDFIWLLCSKKRRARNALFDKIALLPSATFLIAYDLYLIITSDIAILPYVMGGVLCYLSLVYLFEAVYYWFHLHPALAYALEEDAKEEKKKSEEEAKALLSEEPKKEESSNGEEKH